jgi:hypothetical protein
MASKIDKEIARLEKLTRDLNEIKLKEGPLLPIPRPLKTALRTVAEDFDNITTDLYFDTVRGIADVVLPANVASEVINNPDIVIDNQGQIVRRDIFNREKFDRILPVAAAKPRKVTAKMKKQRKIQSIAFRNANAKGRKKDGTFRSGYDQSRIARMAQKECTKERQRLGLCEKPKRRSTRKGQVRKTARRAFE